VENICSFVKVYVRLSKPKFEADVALGVEILTSRDIYMFLTMPFIKCLTHLKM
jgi:hypothetical protein